MTTAPAFLHTGRTTARSPRLPEPAPRSSVETIERPDLEPLFDSLVCDVYGRALLATREPAEAERITDAVVVRMQRLVTAGGWADAATLRSRAFDLTRRELAAYSRRQTRTASLHEMRATTRHLVLIASAAFAAFYAAIALV